MDGIIAWTPELSVGVAEIDEQHKKFIGIVEDFYSALDEDKVQSELEDILKKLIEYADFHFATEENYFDKFDYEFKEEHKQKHSELRKKALDFQEKFKKEGAGITLKFLAFLTEWLVDHLETEDHKYVKCFHDHGLL